MIHGDDLNDDFVPDDTVYLSDHADNDDDGHRQPAQDTAAADKKRKRRKKERERIAKVSSASFFAFSLEPLTPSPFAQHAPAMNRSAS